MSRVHIPKLGIIAALRQKTDYKRWADTRNLYSEWEPRTQRAAELIPAGSRVIEFGAGTRTLEKHLDPSCTYTPSDLVDRGPGTLVCDLNERPLPNLGKDTYDVAVIMGVLEYLKDVPSVLDWLSAFVPRVVVSYGCPDSNDQFRRTKLGSVDRISRGWLNSYLEEDIRTLFRDRGYASLHEENWANVDGYQHRLFVFAQQ
ncbi:class I SAM-dependent methyltransferase [Mycobacterium crocinum]|nr:class I SAM-dependent methyltransferase [Mycolicibacterium crocinum]